MVTHQSRQGDAQPRVLGLDGGRDLVQIPAGAGMTAGEQKQGGDEDRALAVRPRQAAQHLQQEFAIEVVLGTGATFHGGLLDLNAGLQPGAQVRRHPAPGGVDLGAGGAMIHQDQASGLELGLPGGGRDAVQEDGGEAWLTLGQGAEGGGQADIQRAGVRAQPGRQGWNSLGEGPALAEKEGDDQKALDTLAQTVNAARAPGW